MSQKEKIINLYVNKQYSFSRIAKLVNIERHKISSYLKEWNIIIRPRTVTIRLAKDIIGKKFKKLSVLKYDKNGKYICKCSCGKIKTIRRDALIEKHTLSCGCYNIKILKKARIWGYVRKSKRISVATSFAQYKQHAKIKKQKFELTPKIFFNLVSNKCYYCGHFSKRGFNGVDRLNNIIGYTLKNSVSCCAICNHAKHILSKTIFLNKIKQIYNYSIKNKKG